MRSVFVHNHIYKNAGMTVDAVFEKAGFRNVPIEATQGEQVVHPRRIVEAVVADPAIEYVSSHSLHSVRPDDLDDVVFIDITFLRHPLDRLYSIYRYFAQPHVQDFAVIPKSASFAQFVEGVERHAPSHLHSPQTTCLGNWRKFHFVPGAPALARAKATVAETRFLGVVDLIDVSFGAFVGCNRPLLEGKNVAALERPIESVNQSPGGSRHIEERLAAIALELGPDLYRFVEAANHCDLELYWFARDEVLRREAALLTRAAG